VGDQTPKVRVIKRDDKRLEEIRRAEIGMLKILMQRYAREADKFRQEMRPRESQTA
jgi:hypothetical protein